MKKQLLLVATLIIISFMLVSLTTAKLQQDDPWVAPEKYQKIENPYLNAVDKEKTGRILYTKHCKSCHGTKGKGDGKKAESLDTPTGDFTDDSFKKQTDGSLYYKTFFGRDDMPSFKKKIINKEDQWLLINYIKNF